MTSVPKPKATEERLQEIKNAAAGLAPEATGRNHPQIQGRDSYYGLPALKPPVWTWEVPLYFFLGGISGVSECLAFVAQIFHPDDALIRALLWIALIGAAICPALLIADLGRPSRFLNMLRVFKLQSPMSMGVWLLVAFSGCAFLSLASHELILHGFTSVSFVAVRWLGEFTGTITGLLLASYTGVLIGATAIPVWLHNRKILPAHFLTSGLGGSAAILELLGFLIPTTQILGFVSAGIETLMEILFEARKLDVNAPLHHGKSGAAFRVAGLLEGLIALLLRVFWGASPSGRYSAAICFLAGSLLSRYAWIWAGRLSARDVNTQFASQRRG
jgi:formate-dependent nitrite reductase membrane component NrfD